MSVDIATNKDEACVMFYDYSKTHWVKVEDQYENLINEIEMQDEYIQELEDEINELRDIT